MSASPRILITGTGAVCGAGLDAASIWDAVVSGRSAVGPLRQWDASRWPVGIAAEVTGVGISGVGAGLPNLSPWPLAVK